MRFSLALALAGYLYWGAPQSIAVADDGGEVRNALRQPMSLTAAGAMDRRSPLENNFMRLGRSGRMTHLAADDNQNDVNPQRHHRGNDNSNGFIRFGRMENFVGRPDDQDFYMRPARPDHAGNFVRFGRLPPNQFVRLGRPSEPNNFVRFGRNFARDGRAEPTNFVRFGRGDVKVEDEGIGHWFSRPEAGHYVRFGRSTAGQDAEAGAAESEEYEEAADKQ